MKILAIRGCNLASLAGEFEIDLARAPLGGAGVFAIVGNTGAGKSTLLDALCVALFDRTPRLTNHSTVKVGRGSDERALLGAQDVRTLLRRGTAQGWAEVDFESGDARQYRARWSVRRARGQSDGTLQDEQLSLTAIDGGERFGGTKTETLKAIHARLGLSFDQFRRSALLAQGEFAAFLRADGKDRSELLERMTGTQIYSRLSVAAHVKAALAEQRLRDGRATALAITVLDDDQARATRAELEVASAAAQVARSRHAAAEQAARWIAEARKRERALAEAAAEHTATRAGLAGAEADRAELALRRRAEQLRPAWDQAARLARAVAVAADEAVTAGSAAARASLELAAIGERRAQIAASHAPVRAARIAAGIVERSRGAVGAEAVQADDAAWLTARSALAPEIAAWPELDARFAQHAALGDAIAALDRALAEHAESKAKLERAHKLLAGELRTATHKHEDAKRKASGYSQKRGLTLDAARRQEDEARTRLGELERLVAIAAGARAQVQARAEVDHQLAQHAAAASGDDERRAELAEAQRFAHALRGEQARVVDDLRRAAGYEHARAELVDDEPCPLCGATEHPWRDRGALDGVIASATDRLGATLAELDALASEAAAIAARGQHRARERTGLVGQRAAAVAAEAAAASAWQAQLRSLGELLLVGDPALPAAEDLAADRHALARKALEEARATRSQTEAATKAAQDAQAEVQLCQVAVDQLAAKLTELDRRLAELDAALGRSRGERASKQDRHGELAGELAAAMARWEAALPGDEVVRIAQAAGPRVRARDADRTSGSRAHVGGGDDPNAAGARTNEPRAHVGGAKADTGAADTGGATEPRAHVGGGNDQNAAAVDRTSGLRAHVGGASQLQVHADGAIDARLALALVGRLQASAPLRPGRDAVPSGPLAIVRLAMAAVVVAWRERADRIAHADAVLAAAMTAVESAARDIDRAVAEHAARSADAERRRAKLAGEHDAAVAQLEALRAAAGFGRGPAASRPRAVPAGTSDVGQELAAGNLRTVQAGTSEIANINESTPAGANLRPVPAGTTVGVDVSAPGTGKLRLVAAVASGGMDASAAVAGNSRSVPAGTSVGVDVSAPAGPSFRVVRAGLHAASEASSDELGRLLAADPSRVDALAERLAGLERAVDRTRAVVSERERQVAEHAQGRPAIDGFRDLAAALDPRQPSDAARTVDRTDEAAVVADHAWFSDGLPSDPATHVAMLGAAVVAADRRAAQLAHMLAADGEARERRAAALADLSAEETGAEVDRVLGDVIGSHDGKLFRSFAQSLTLDSLLAVANAHLEELAPRYQLERVPRHDLELQVIDRDLGSEVRSVQSLSGGESFLVSLALALGLSSMSAHDVRVRTLLIDEGFGTLDPATLDSALSVLDALQATGRQVGVISHVPALVERVGAHVRVVQRGGGRSEVIVA